MTRELISYEDALAIMRANLKPCGVPTLMPSEQCLGLALAEPLVAKEASPRFDNSAVDGYAVGEPWPVGEARRQSGSVAAGGPALPLRSGEALRVMTGAPLPSNAWAVAMQEDVKVAQALELSDQLKPGDGIRRAGSEFQVGDLLVKEGQPLTPGCLGLLASQGVGEVRVWPQQRVLVIATGDELSDQPGDGQIYDSNGPMLKACLSAAGVTNIETRRMKDNLDELRSAIASANANLVIVSGGASVGDYDFLPHVVDNIHFHGVRLRPGKPVLFGHSEAAVFGLPGNPAGAFACFHLFVLEAIRILGGWANPVPEWLPLPFRGKVKPYHRDDFVRCRWFEGALQTVGLQASFGMRSLAEGEWLVRLPAGTSCEGVTTQIAMRLL